MASIRDLIVPIRVWSLLRYSHLCSLTQYSTVSDGPQVSEAYWVGTPEPRMEDPPFTR